MRYPFVPAILVSAIALTSCTSTQFNEAGRDYGTPILCGAGLLAGGVLGYAVNGKKGAVVGAVAGTAAGCYAGSIWQSRMQELDRIAKEQGLTIKMQQLAVASTTTGVKPIDAGFVAQVDDTSVFNSGSDQLSPSGRVAFTQIAATYAKALNGAAGADRQRRLLVVGHTDATGSAQSNQALSERRALAVGRVLQQAGIPAEVIFYQGAGASRPVADNADPLQRGRNRRVEIVDTTSEDVLIKRIKSEQSSTKYLSYGTATQSPKQRASTAPAVAKNERPVKKGNTTPAAAATEEPVAVTTTPTKTKVLPTAQVDFGGAPAQIASRGYEIKPKADGFTLIASAQASTLPTGTCEADRPRQTGQVMSLANEKPVQTHVTTDYLPGYNGRVWANTVNGHLVTLSPVSILRDGAAVGQQPFIQIVQGYDTPATKKTLAKLDTITNTYEGESEVLYRVFVNKADAPIDCLDVVFSKGNAEASKGALFYPDKGEEYTATFVPKRT